jgi:hypothetical protein
MSLDSWFLIRVIDIETTGIDPAADAIIEIASVDMVRDGGITNAMDTLVRPTKPIPPGASAVRHIIDEDVTNAPAFSEVIDRFKGADFYSSGASSRPRASSLVSGSARTNVRCAFGPSLKDIRTRSCAMRWVEQHPFQGSSAARFRRIVQHLTPL